VTAYDHAADAVARMDEHLAAADAALSGLEDRLQRSRTAIEGDVQALARLQKACETLTSAQPLLEPDHSQALIAAASRAYMEAERLHGLGTREGYETSLALSQRAQAYLAESETALGPLPERLSEVRRLLRDLSPQALGSLRGRAERLRHDLSAFGWHWNAGLAGRMAAAIANLEQAEVDLERLSPNVRYERSMRQSELGEARDLLTHAHGTLAATEGALTELEAEAQRLEDKRDRWEQAVAALQSRTLPPIESLAPKMLPELRERLEQTQASLAIELPNYTDPAKTDYDHATDVWLAAKLRQVEELRNAHAADVAHYRRQAEEAAAELERDWAALARLEPEQRPGPAENVEGLAEDLDDWRRDVEQHLDDPAALRELTGARHRGLKQRLERAIAELTTGRRERQALTREFQRQMQELRAFRDRVRDRQRANNWPRLGWETDEAASLWNEVLALERDSHALTKIGPANDRLQRAVNAAIQATQLYASLHTEMQTALKRLDADADSLEANLARAQRRVEQLREQGDEVEARTWDEACASATRQLEMARAAANYEDALRYLREGLNHIGRR
ncbi:MAG: hypothetical protein V1772_02935, partial [Chloroflexota bacterium]